jgi:C-terminal peptidase prc
MTDELDPFSGYVRFEQLEQFEEDLSGGYFGIGISVVGHDSGLLILDVREGSPAATSGVLVGDIITASDTVNLTGMSSSEAVKLIKGKENSIFKATIFRPATENTFTLDIVRKRIDFLHIPFAGFTPDSAAYIRLLDFNAGAAEDFRNALDTLIRKENRAARGVIIDLRGNPGGLFSEARDIAEMFLKKGEFVVGTSSRSKWNEESYYATNEGDYSDLPVAILIDNGSASAAEILAGTLKYSGHAVLVGDTTFGKGLVQGFIRLPEGDGLRLTISRYYFDGDRYINPLDSAANVQGVGLSPDIGYSYVEEEPFYIQLELQLILLRFAHIHQDNLVDAIGYKNEKLKWIELLRKFAYENKFNYKSKITESAEWLVSDSDTDRGKSIANRAVKIARSLDEGLFEKYSDFLWMRLGQIAYERKYGTYAAYKDIVVLEYEPIQIASQALIKRDSL